MTDRLLLAALLLAAQPAEDPTDRVVPVEGKELACRVVYESDEVVVAQVGRKQREFERVEVAAVHSIERSVRRLLEQWDRAASGGVEGLRELALFCESNHLPGEARNLWFRIVTVDPENEEAWTRLGGSRARKEWRIKLDGKYETLADLTARSKSWKRARRFSTAHYSVTTDRPLARALDLMLELERVHQAFYELLAPHERLLVFEETPEVFFYSQRDDYPTPTVASDAWFSATDNALHVLDASDDDLSAFAEDLNGLLLYNAFRASFGLSGSIAPWARYGLGRAFADSAFAEPGAGRWDLAEPYRPDFAAQAGGEDPLTLKQLLRSDYGSFRGNSNGERFSIAAYTLTHFLLFADPEGTRPLFVAFMRSSYAGQGSTTHFEKLFARDLEELEAAWLAYVRDVAGG